MAFHKSSLGGFGNNLPCDLQGYVPEVGDRSSDFNWPADYDWDADQWSQYVDVAAMATAEAETALALWQGGALTEDEAEERL